MEFATTDRQRSLDEWLDATKDDDQYDRFLAACLDGTCEWILRHPSYLKWEGRDEKKEVAKLLWIHGPAGFGKTILCASLIRHLSNDMQRPLVYCFSASHARNPDGLSGVIRTWLTQMVRLDKGAFDIAFNFVRERNTRRASEEDVWTLLNRIIGPMQDCVLVLDGLDEFQGADDQRKIFLSRLKKCLQSTTTSALITSRSEFDINSELRPSVPEVDKYSILECKISEDTVRSDIDTFATSIVDQRLPGKGDSLRRELGARMAERCQGQFLWLKLQQSQLRDSKSPNILRKSIEVMPQGLHSSYEHSWNSIQALDEPDRSRTIDTLRWLTFAFQPLTVQVLAEALVNNLNLDSKGFSEDDLPDEIDDAYIDGEIKQLCGSLVEVQDHSDPGSRVVRLVHASVYDFLAAELPPSPFLGLAPMRSALSSAQDAVLAAHCICFLDSGNTWEPSDLQRVHSFRTYAVETWFTHLRGSYSHYNDICDFVGQFVKPGNGNFEKWKKEYEGSARSLTAEGGTSFYYAAEFGLVQTMIDLHDEERVDVNSVGGLFGTALQAVCARGNREGFDLLMHWHADPTIGGGEFGGALNAAAFYADIAMVGSLLDTGLFNGSTSELHEAMRLAARKGSLGVVRLLIDRGAPVDPPEALYPPHLYFIEGELATTPLLAAAQASQVEVIRLLLEQGANPNLSSIPGKMEWTALHLAVTASLEAVKLLLLHGADINSQGPLGTPLHLASEDSSIEVVKALLDNGAAIDAYDKCKETPLHIATKAGRSDIVAYLLRAGTNPNSPNEIFKTPLHIASQNGDIDTVKALLENGASIDANDNDRSTPLQLAAQYGRTDVLVYLLHEGANQNAQDMHGWTPLSLAAHAGEMKAITTLLEHGTMVNINAQTNEGMTSLGMATYNNHTEIARLLMDRGADINLQGDDGETALRMALARSGDEFVRHLIQSGADLDSMDHYGMTCSGWLNRARPYLRMPEVEGYEPDKISSGPDMPVLRHYFLDHAKDMRSDEPSTRTWLYFLAHCFLLLDMEDHATRAYNHMSSGVVCDGCNMRLIGKGVFFACKMCPTADFCEPCMERHSEKTRQKSCLGHELLKIIPPEASSRADNDDEAFKKWLDDIIEHFAD